MRDFLFRCSRSALSLVVRGLLRNSAKAASVLSLAHAAQTSNLFLRSGVGAHPLSEEFLYLVCGQYMLWSFSKSHTWHPHIMANFSLPARMAERRYLRHSPSSSLRPIVRHQRPLRDWVARLLFALNYTLGDGVGGILIWSSHPFRRSVLRCATKSG